jgi:LPXTG-site transpeptidase (sortase) family protein
MSYFMPVKYVKEYQKEPVTLWINPAFALRSRVLPYTLPFIASLLLFTQVVIPLVSFTTQESISRPVRSSALGYATGFQDFSFEELEEDNVLGTTTNIYGDDTGTVPEYFYISIPKLGIEEALVETNEETLDPIHALGHYKNSAYPGEVGNTFIYGHSVLPFFYNPDNYKTIFSTLDQLEEGDEILVTYNGRKLKYEVEGKRELKPIDVHPLAEIKPSYLNESTMVLMTCSPAGTKLRRLLIDTVMVN